eukprot:GFYU01002238.1.p1 GENE.GFYU01002238.1~~GFYU01002238.1.p1  ORF type:complete len:409 (+),score=21.91 GFYU01002238.1:50-1276(+)
MPVEQDPPPFQPPTPEVPESFERFNPTISLENVPCTPQAIVATVAALLQAAEDSSIFKGLRTRFRLELTLEAFPDPVPPLLELLTCAITLRFNVLQYYNLVLEAERKEGRSISKTSEFLESLKTYLNKYLQITQLRDGTHDDERHAPTVDFCRHGNKCNMKEKRKGGRTVCTKTHLPVCELDADRSGPPQACGFMIQPDVQLQRLPIDGVAGGRHFLDATASENGLWQVLRRTEDTRDLLVMPQVYSAESEYCERVQAVHTNPKAVGDQGFWRAMLGTADVLANATGLSHLQVIDRMHVNFGRWETASAADEKLRSCHAHGHVLYTQTAAKALEGKFKHSPIARCQLDPIDVGHTDDCEKLLTRRAAVQSDLVKEDLAEVKATLGEMSSVLQQLSLSVAQLRRRGSVG